MGLAATKQEAFWEACGFGHTNRVKKFLEDPNIKVDWVSYTHNSCAIHVASQGKMEIVKMLLERNCKVNVLDDRGNLPLHHAAMKGHADIMQLLIDSGSEINTQDKNDWSPLISAAYFCQPDSVDCLITNKCDVTLLNKDERTALHQVCRTQNTNEEGVGRIVASLVAAGADINRKSSDAGEADFTPLMFASYHGHPRAAEELIKAGCKLNCQGSNDWSALHWAADRGHAAVIEVLLEAGLDPLLKGRRGELAFHRAQNEECKKLLRAATGDAAADTNGFTHGEAAGNAEDNAPPPVPGSNLAASLSEKREKPTISNSLSVEDRQRVLDEVMKSVDKAKVEQKRITKLMRQQDGLPVDDDDEDEVPVVTINDEPVENINGLEEYIGHLDGEHVHTADGGILVSYASRGSVSTMDPLSDAESSDDEGEYEPNQNPKNVAPSEESSQSRTADQVNNLNLGNSANGLISDTNANPST